MATITIRRCNGSKDAWGAFCGEHDFCVGTSLSLDLLVERILETHGACDVLLKIEEAE